MIARARANNNAEQSTVALAEAQRQTAAMLAAIFAPEDWICFHAVGADGGRRWATLADDEIDQVVEWVWHTNTARQKCQPFFGANPRRGDGQDSAEGTAYARCYFADWDVSTAAEAIAKVSEAELPPPTVLMESGRGVHAYWRLHEPEHDAGEWTHRQKWIAAALQSDPAVSDWQRKMRLPGFFNVKPAYAPDYPVSRLVLAEPMRCYSWKDIQPRHAPVPPRRVEPTPEQLAEIARMPPGSMSGLSKRFLKDGFTLPEGRRLTAFTVACDLAARGWLPDRASAVIRKALARWLNRGPKPLTKRDIEDAHRQVFAAFSKPRTPIIDSNGPPPLRVEQDDHDGGEAVPLGAYRDRIAVAVAQAVQMPGVHINTAGTGCGKTRATAKAVAGLPRSVTSCPTHVLCEERARELREFGADAAAYPPLDAETCENFAEASKVQAAGLSPGRVVCPSCPFHDQCAANGYLSAVKAADKARHKVVTHARLARSAKVVCKGSDCIVLEEEPTAAVRPSIAARVKELRTVAEFAKAVAKQLRHDADAVEIEVDLSDVGFDDPEHGLPTLPAGFSEFAAWAPPAGSPEAKPATDSVRDVVHGPRRHTRTLAAKRLHKAAFFRHVADVARYAYAETRAAMRRGPGVYVIPMPAALPSPKNVDALVWPVLSQSSDPVPPDALRLAVAAASGAMQSLVVQIDANERYSKANPGAKPLLRARTIGLWQTALPYGTVPVIINDGTNDRATVEAIVGRDVHDITPPGRVPLQHECVQYAADVTLGTKAQQVANIIGGLARAHRDRPRLGVIMLKAHRDELFPDEDHLPADEPRRRKRQRKRKRPLVFPMAVRHRIDWHTHFGSGLDRGCNDMHERVDLALVVGTFRPPSHEVRRRLIEVGLVAEAHAGDEWGVIERHGRKPDGTPVVYRGLGYRGDAWRRAAESLTKAAARQAIGRARANNARGVPVIAVTTEATGLPVLPADDLPRSSLGIERIAQAVEEAARINLSPTGAKNAIDNKAEMAPVDAPNYTAVDVPLSAIRERLPAVPRRTLLRWIGEAVEAVAINRTGQTSAVRYSVPPPPRRPDSQPVFSEGCPSCGCREHRDRLSGDEQMGRRECAECGAFICFTVWHGKPVAPPPRILSARVLDVARSVSERGQRMAPQLAAADQPLSREEAAKHLGISPVTLACWAARGIGPAYSRSGSKRGKVWYRAADLDAWLESRSVKPRA